MTRLKAIGVAGLLVLSIGAVLLAQGVRIEPGALRVVGGAITASASADRAVQITRSGSNAAGISIGNADRTYGLVIDSGSSSEFRIQEDSDGSPRLAVDAANNTIELVATAGVTNLNYYRSATEQPGFSAYNSATDTHTSVGSVDPVDFDSEQYDDGADFASDTFTAPVDGKYRFCGTVRLTNNSGVTRRFALKMTPTNPRLLDEKEIASGSIGALSGCTETLLSATNTVRLKVETDASATFNIHGVSGFEQFTHFTGRLLP